MPVRRSETEAEGRRRNPTNWTYTSIPSYVKYFTRGTTHEHLDKFALINMNGRMYDPVVGRFLSTDKFVQAQNTQNYNRYSYCINNPLKYNDPNGEFFWTILTGIFDYGRTMRNTVLRFYKAIFTGGLNSNDNIRHRAWGEFKSGVGQDWSNFDPSRPGSKTNNSWKIDIGMYKTDPNRKPIGNAIQLISRFTWEAPQTTSGNIISHIRNLCGAVDNVDYYGGATLVNADKIGEGGWGFTLGSYINSKNMDANPYTDKQFQNEFGHTLQSRLMGPLYMLYVVPFSPIGSCLDKVGLNDHSREWYENQANRMAYRYFENHDPLHLVPSLWDDSDNPRKYNPNWYWCFAHPPILFMWWLFF